MGMFDFVKLDHPMFGEDRGHRGQTKDFDCPSLETYGIDKDGRLHSPSERFDLDEGAPIPATPEPMDYHGYLWVWGKGDYKWKCKFTDGLLVAAEKVDV